ncbi:MAG TPA: hypothetical protein VMV57_15970 [Terracidiphilus sp.]|nr:hypothetical protein [Terracidiphilus sp.]
MGDAVKIVECPRDAWQGLPGLIPAERKAAYLRRLLDAGFRQLDSVSFVSPAAVPQMADSERVLELLEAPADAEILGIVVNAQGAERAIRTGRVQTLGFPYSISTEFLRRNQRQTQAEALQVLQMIVEQASGAGLNVVAYVSMAFGNPYGEAWSAEAAAEACDALLDAGVREISLADTVGAATGERVAETVATVRSAHAEAEIGVHLHARRSEAAARILAAYDAGCRRFDAALGGLGGCPFAQDEMVGNIPTELLLATLAERTAELPGVRDVDGLCRESAEIAREFGKREPLRDAEGKR